MSRFRVTPLRGGLATVGVVGALAGAHALRRAGARGVLAPGGGAPPRQGLGGVDCDPAGPGGAAGDHGHLARISRAGRAGVG